MNLNEVLTQYINEKCTIGILSQSFTTYYNGEGIIEEVGEGWIKFVDTSRFEYIIPISAIAYIRRNERREKKKRNE